MKKITILLVALILALNGIGCKSKKEKVYEQQMEAIRQIFVANNLNAEEELKTGIARNLQTKEISDLNLSNRNLTTLPPEIGLLTGLEELDLSGNKLTELPEEIGKLVKLRKLNVSENRLTELPSSIGNLVKLESIDLGHNELRTLPPEINNLTEITELIIWRNKLETLPDSLHGLVKIEFLDMDYNNFTVFPISLKTMPNLGSVFFHLLDTNTIPEGVTRDHLGRFYFIR